MSNCILCDHGFKAKKLEPTVKIWIEGKEYYIRNQKLYDFIHSPHIKKYVRKSQNKIVNI